MKTIKRRKAGVLLLGVFIILPILNLAQTTLSLDTCYELARRNYPLTKQFGLIEKTKEYSISNANKAYLPQISLTAIGGYITGLPSFSLPGETSESNNAQFIGIGQINQTIWDGGATRTQKNIVNATAEVDKANLEVNLRNMRERVNQLYFGILLIDEQLKQLDILNSTLHRNLKNVELTKENGLAYKSDVDEVRAEVLKAEQKKIEFTYTRKGYLEMLAYLIGRQLTESIQLEKPVSLESVSSLGNNRPELNLYSNQRNLIEAKSSFNRVANMPKIGLLGAGVMIKPGMDLGPSTFSSIAVVGLSVSWNTSNLYKTSNNKQLDRIQSDMINIQQETFVFNNTLQLKQASDEIEKHQAILSKDNEIVMLKENITKSYQVKYNNGAGSMNDLLNSLNKESEAKSNQMLHNIELLLSVYNYKTISGN